MDDDAADTLELAEILSWAEFCAWSALVMTPIIWWLQGPSVSTDQFVVRTGLVVISASVAVGLRGWALVQRRRDAMKTSAGEGLTDVISRDRERTG
jgi:hypothetical protein